MLPNRPLARRPWQQDKGWSDQYILLTKKCLAHHLAERIINIGNDKEDQEENTDLRVATIGDLRIACRIRRPPARVQYYEQFTIRASRPSGAKTEYEKVMSGWGNYIFYAWISSDSQRFDAYVIGDLNVFRSYVWNYYKTYGYEPGSTERNPDGSSTFRAYNIAELPQDFVVGRRIYTPAIVAVPRENIAS